LKNRAARCLTVATFFFLSLPVVSQVSSEPKPEVALQKQIDKYPGLVNEFGRLFLRMQHEVTFPQERSQSNLLPLLSPSTTYFIALPNYGESAHEALEIFRDELKQNSMLRNWWHSDEMAKTAPDIEDFFERFYLLSQFLGDEIVLSGSTGEQTEKPVLLAEVRKSGLRELLLRMSAESGKKSKFNFLVIDPHELTLVKSLAKLPDLMILVRPDFVIAAPDIASVRKYDALLTAANKQFPSTPFGQRILQSYQGGVSVVGAADVHSIASQYHESEVKKNQQILEQTGFNDVKYLVWDRKSSGLSGVSETELSFIGPRHGAAAWLAPPAKLGSLDFVSPKSPLVLSLALKNLGDVFEDVKQFSTYSNPNAFAMLPDMERAMQINLKDDLLSQLQGEITFELQNIEKEPTWDIILRVKDQEHLQRTFDKLLASAPVQARNSEESGVLYRSLLLPAKEKPFQVTYAFVDGYLVFASSQDTAAQAFALRKSGDGLGSSKLLSATLPSGYSPEVSALLYENATAMSRLQMQRFMPEMASSIPTSSEPMTVAYRAYGDERAIRGVSSSGGFDVAGVLIGAAIAIPNLLRARIAANESSAVANLRTLNTAQIAYSITYPRQGYAHGIVALGPDPRNGNAYSPQHAGLVDAELAGDNCTAVGWCTRSGYSFHLRAVCKVEPCKEYVVVATPKESSSGGKNFCSTSDAIIRVQIGPPLQAPITASQCRTWPAL
jgi:type II secretory pathway pseudopilin PulG